VKSSRAWVRRVERNPQFKFTAKLFKAFTHERNARREDKKVFKQGLAPLAEAGRLGGLLLQFPWSFKNTDEEKPLLGVPLPSRGVVEVKPTSEELSEIAETKQVREYLEHYGQVLLTNYRDFLLLKRAKGGKTEHLESFQLAPDEKSFWAAAALSGVELIAYVLFFRVYSSVHRRMRAGELPPMPRPPPLYTPYYPGMAYYPVYPGVPEGPPPSGPPPAQPPP